MEKNFFHQGSFIHIIHKELLYFHISNIVPNHKKWSIFWGQGTSVLTLLAEKLQLYKTGLL
jgi:hypothetical protein